MGWTLAGHTVQRFGGVVTTPDEARQLCAVNNSCNISSTLACVDADTSYRGSVAMNFVGDLIVTRTRRLALTYDRSLGNIARDHDDAVFLHINVGTERFGGRQLGRDWTLAPEEASLYVHNEAVRLTSREGGDFLGVALPRLLTADWCERPEDMVGRAFDTTRPEYRMIRHYLELISEGDGVDDNLMAMVRVHVADLAGLWTGGLRSRDWTDRRPAPRQAARYAAILGHLRRNFDRSDLGAEEVAKALGLSIRLLQQVLTEEGSSFSKLLGQVRAEAVRARLADPRYDAQTVTALAFACGFSDLAAFYRAFRARFDTTPNDVRASR